MKIIKPKRHFDNVTGILSGEAIGEKVARIKDMAGFYADENSRKRSDQDILVYRVQYYFPVPEGTDGGLFFGNTTVFPGKVGDEYFMTKGHFHTVLETDEVYYCLKGEGYMVMETPEGDWSVEPLRPGCVLYVPPRWAHRSVNTGKDEDLVTFFVYPGHAGHDYGTIEEQGFRKLVVEENGQPKIVDNPRWRSPDAR